MAEIASQQIAATGIAGQLLREPPTVVVTAPIGPLLDPTVTVAWTYSSVLSKPQSSYRVQILNQFESAVLFDSGVIRSADTSYDCPFLLSSGSQYVVKVTCSDGTDDGSDTSPFSSEQVGVNDFAEEGAVGPVYEVAINGLGLRLAENPQRPDKRSTGQLQSPRLATGSTPFSEAIERYSFAGTGDWTLGAGQEMADRAESDPRAYLDSECVNPFEPGGLRLLNRTAVEVASTATGQFATVASGKLFVKSDTDEMLMQAIPGGTPAAVAFTGETIERAASDGTHWYVSTAGREIFQGASTAIGTAWADLTAQTSAIDLIEWCSDRLGVAYMNGSGQACFSTLSPSGAEETAGGRFKHSDAEITAITSGDGYVWYSVNRSDRSVVYAWQLGSADASFVALELPKGEYVTALYHYLGNVMIRAATDVDATTVKASIYRAVPNQGELSPERVTTMETEGVDQGPGRFVGLDRFVLFSWAEMALDGRSGVGAIDLSTGGWCKWLQAPSDTHVAAVPDLFVWNNLAGFSVDGVGAVWESSVPCASGFLISSVGDGGSGLTKVIDEVMVKTEPLPASATVSVEVSVDDANSFVSFGTVAQAGSKGGTFLLGEEASAVATRLVLTAAGVGSPVVRIAQYKLHPLSAVDTVVELPVDCSDRMVGANGVEIQDAQPVGLDRARWLEGLVGTRVRFQDVDWPVTRQAETWEMVSAEYSALGVYTRSIARRAESAAVCVVTLRRAQ